MQDNSITLTFPKSLKPHFIILGLLVFHCNAVGKVNASEQEKSARLFSLKIRNVLSSKCFACHGEDKNKIKGELDLTSHEGLLRGGESGTPAIRSGKPMHSPLYLAITREHDDDWSVMPPKENDKLSDKQIEEILKQQDQGQQLAAMQQQTIGKLTEQNQLLLEANQEKEEKKVGFWGRLVGQRA